jgi:hypothetical protein
MLAVVVVKLRFLFFEATPDAATGNRCRDVGHLLFVASAGDASLAFPFLLLSHACHGSSRRPTSQLARHRLTTLTLLAPKQAPFADEVF